MKVLFYPDPPVQLHNHSLSKTIQNFQMSGYELTNDPKDNWDIGVHWDHRDISDIPEIFFDDNREVFNMKLTDITKSNVDKVFTSVFGYSSMADTEAFGYCVRKSEKQSTHDGRIIKTPCKKEEGYIYQKLIDNRSSLSMIYDIRVPIMIGEIPDVFIKNRSIEGLFEPEDAKRKDFYVISKDDILSTAEQTKIKLFCKTIGLNIGEIDILRDNSTGLIYVTDVNNIPGSLIYGHLEDPDKIKKSHNDFFRRQLNSHLKQL